MSSIEPNDTAELIVGDAKSLALKVALHWQGDRFEHRIFLIASDQEHLLFESLPGDRDSSWPKSPPLQQASIEESNGRPTIQGVGLAGTSRWTVNVETSDDDGPAIRFDHTCKATETAEYLGSRYTWPDGIESNTDAFAGILFQTAGHFVQISPDDAGSLATCSKEENWWEVRPEAISETSRWQYRIGLM